MVKVPSQVSRLLNLSLSRLKTLMHSQNTKQRSVFRKYPMRLALKLSLFGHHWCMEQGSEGNFHSMIKWVKKGVPLPLGAVKNKRSMIALDNLVDLILTCIDHPKAANEVFLVSDDNDLSTSEILQCLACAMGKKSRLIPVPEFALLLAARLLRFRTRDAETVRFIAGLIRQRCSGC